MLRTCHQVSCLLLHSGRGTTSRSKAPQLSSGALTCTDATRLANLCQDLLACYPAVDVCILIQVLPQAKSVRHSPARSFTSLSSQFLSLQCHSVTVMRWHCASCRNLGDMGGKALQRWGWWGESLTKEQEQFIPLSQDTAQEKITELSNPISDTGYSTAWETWSHLMPPDEQIQMPCARKYPTHHYFRGFFRRRITYSFQ